MLSRVGLPVERVHAVAADPSKYPAFMPTVEAVDVTKRAENAITYITHLEIPLIDLRVRSLMRHLPEHRISIRILDGDINRGRFAWEFLPERSGTLAVFYSSTDASSQSWLLRALLSKEPYFEHGINVGLGLVSMTAVVERAHGP